MDKVLFEYLPRRQRDQEVNMRVFGKPESPFYVKWLTSPPGKIEFEDIHSLQIEQERFKEGLTALRSQIEWYRDNYAKSNTTPTETFEA